MWTWEETHRISSSPICLFTWLCWVLVGAHWIFRLCCGMWNLSMRRADSQLLQVGSSSHPGVKFRPPVFGGMAAQPLDHQKAPRVRSWWPHRGPQATAPSRPPSPHPSVLAGLCLFQGKFLRLGPPLPGPPSAFLPLQEDHKAMGPQDGRRLSSWATVWREPSCMETVELLLDLEIPFWVFCLAANVL